MILLFLAPKTFLNAISFFLLLRVSDVSPNKPIQEINIAITVNKEKIIPF